ncbi:MAG TPA: ABC transporter ATP-binding protein [Candidatus Bathyarchaeia archaeon]|nr:ABC transporter ATP-binding protein [Candidatus Bathyarchaeia archaeon]
MIKVENLKKTYPGKVPTPALKGVTFSVAKGEILVITGRSGSGKSTLLHQLSLIDTPTEGEILIEDQNILALTDSQKTKFRLENLGYVFQEYALIAELDAMENVYIPAMALGTPPAEYEKRAAELLRIVGLGERMDHYPSELSGGEQQRVAIARALINNPKIIFADEPTANLDTVSAKVVLDLFRKLKKEMKQTIVMITHEEDDLKYADQVLWLKDGLIEKLGKVK